MRPSQAEGSTIARKATGGWLDAQRIDMKRILIYSHDTYGLGNIRRMLAIAETIKREYSNASILLLSGSPMIHSFRLEPGMDYVKLPCLSRDAADSYVSKSLRISKSSILRLRADLIQSTVLNFEPDLILVDKKPLGVGNELAPMLATLRHLDKRPKLVLVLRDILDKPETTIPVWVSNRYHEVIRTSYDRILVLGSSDVFNAVEEYAFPRASADKTFFCGYTNRSDCRRTPEEIRKELGINGGRLVLVATGGGEDGANLVREVLGTVKEFGSKFADHCLVFLGPEMPQAQAERFEAMAVSLPSVTVKRFSRDFVSYVAASDAVVAMGGYNTVAEILSLDVPAVIVPRTEPVSEQEIRAAQLERLGLVKALNPALLCPDELQRALSDAIQQRRLSSGKGETLDFTALQQVVEHVEDLLDDQWSIHGPGDSTAANLVPLAVSNS
jgi:predicted glycosyltransferase